MRVIDTGQPDRFEQEYNYDGLTGWFELSVAKWGDGIVLTLVDITGSKDRQQQLEQANLDLLNANDNLRQFVYVASHDLQEPLRKIMAFSGMLQDQFAPRLGESGAGHHPVNAVGHRAYVDAHQRRAGLFARQHPPRAV